MEDIRQHIEHTLLRPDCTEADILRHVEETLKYGFIGICVPPFWVKKVSRELDQDNANIRLVTVVGFPLGYSKTETKIEEIKQAIGDGATEVDLVMNISSFKSQMPWTKIELAKCSTIVHNLQAFLKVIIETAYLTDEEIRRAASICADSGVDFVKTSTGFASSGANSKDIRLLRKVLPDGVGIKASGGIKTFRDAVSLIEAGAERIGTSSGPAIADGAIEENAKSS